MSNVLHVSVPLELGARIVSHLSLRWRSRDFLTQSVAELDGFCLIFDRHTADGSHDLTPKTQRLLLLHELFSHRQPLPIPHFKTRSYMFQRQDILASE